MKMTFLFAGMTLLLYVMVPRLNLLVIRQVFGLSFFLDLFYLVGHYLGGWPFPVPPVIVQITIVVALGVALGVMFDRLWPIPEDPGFERVLRTVLIVSPAIGLGIGLQLLLQGPHAEQSLYLIFALSAWLGSGGYGAGFDDEEDRSPNPSSSTKDDEPDESV